MHDNGVTHSLDRLTGDGPISYLRELLLWNTMCQFKRISDKPDSPAKHLQQQQNP